MVSESLSQEPMATHFNSISELPELDALQAESMGNSRICVAVLDGSVDLTHPCFEGANLTTLPTLVSEVAGNGLMADHGTHVTSVIFGQPGSAVRGIAPDCRGLLVPVFSDRRPGQLSQLDLARAIEQAVDKGAHIINISGGELSQSGQADPMLVRAVRLCKDNNVLIVAATGNNGCDCLHVPAALDSVLAVGALNAEGVPLDSSNWGQAYQTQGILAPGEKILGAIAGGSTATRSGTSFATPIVVGIAALLLSIQEQRGEKPDPQAVRAAILNSAFPCPPETIDDTRRCLVGKLNIAGAHRLILQGEPIEMSEKKLDIKPSQVDNLDQENEQEEELYPIQEPSGVLPGNGGVQVAQAARYPSSRTSTIKPSGDCGCNGGRVTPSMQSNTVFSLIYAIGTLGYDFGTEARRDSFKQQMAEVRSDNYQPLSENEQPPPGVFPIPANPYDARQMVHHLRAQIADASSLIWTLNLELTPVYAIEPQPYFAHTIYDKLIEFLDGQILAAQEMHHIERVSIPGVLTGKTVKLFSGQVVPVIEPLNPRGMYGWKINQIVESVISSIIHANQAQVIPPETEAAVRYSLENFMKRIYYDLRNLGQTSQERALNFSVTNTFQQAKGLVEVLHNKRYPGTGNDSARAVTMQLDSIDVEKSPFCRLDSDCWDVKIKFFDPENKERAKRVMRYTIDVSDIMPVTLGDIRIWDSAD